MEQSIDALRAEMWKDRYDETFKQLYDAQEDYQILLMERDRLKRENSRLQGCLKDIVNTGTAFLKAVRASIDGIDGAREARFRDAIEAGRKEIDE